MFNFENSENNKEKKRDDIETFVIQVVSLRTLRAFNIIARTRTELVKVLKKLGNNVYISSIQILGKIVEAQNFISFADENNKPDDMNFGNTDDEEGNTI